jgi:hypothetical protein
MNSDKNASYMTSRMVMTSLHDAGYVRPSGQGQEYPTYNKKAAN